MSKTHLRGAFIRQDGKLRWGWGILVAMVGNGVSWALFKTYQDGLIAEKKFTRAGFVGASGGLAASAAMLASRKTRGAGIAAAITEAILIPFGVTANVMVDASKQAQVTTTDSTSTSLFGRAPVRVL
jgi:hypothetical protein